MKVGTMAIAFVISTLSIGASSLTASAQNATATVSSAPNGVRSKVTVKMYATVLSINTDTREVLLMDQNGKLHNITVSEDARNFGQVRVGDKINLEYTEAISLKLRKRGAGGAQASVEDVAARAPVGAKPGAAVGRQVTAIATVVAIDTKDQQVTLKGPMGNEYDLTVQDPAQLKTIKTGDEVEATYTEAFAISVQSTPNSHP
jgi:Cu/Ag efflux protein CusF